MQGTRLRTQQCGRRIKAITPAFQAGDVGSIPIDRSIKSSLTFFN